jgi:hypothetical protein
VVATCQQLRPYLEEVTTNCDDEVQWANRPPGEQTPATALEVTALADGTPTATSTTIPLPGPTVLSTRSSKVEGSLADLPFDVLIPPTAPGVDTVAAATDQFILISADPGPSAVNTILASGDYGAFAFTGPDFDDYNFVATLRTVIWTLAAVILSVGLLTFAVAAIDRALARRREIAGLLLLGIPPRTLRRAQLVEAVVPIAGGSLLAIAAGLFAGSSYLGLLGDGRYTPWTPTLVLAACSLAASGAIAALTVLGSSGRLDANRIRIE